MIESKKVSLCPACGACPEVVLNQSSEEVLIGEEGNLTKLNKEAWNTLVKKIRAGELAEM
ncbi:hypothetical protein [Candidatus Nitronereus thalassa]|uniref:4Fe-4S ferredoxin-type domain-containing protein n=1 Tax=Candidatus Nitronereus thalassa TaxID=3020898 RepID=A0ABU3K2S3_9BACT|nr:hypothetical protein [Candidatus Nitronereus thalassa]MDT7040712.1 hypothetical protein [Candidatus Nitronereus thalassa]